MCFFWTSWRIRKAERLLGVPGVYSSRDAELLVRMSDMEEGRAVTAPLYTPERMHCCFLLEKH